MRNLKLTLTFAASGFILSLIFGFFSRGTVLRIILQALIWAVVFALVSLLINLLYTKFLAIDEAPVSDDTGYSVKLSSTAAGKSNQNVVNLVVPDADLERSVSDNHFNVGDSHQMLQETDRFKPENNSAAEEKEQFVPVRRKETLDNISGVESIQPGKPSGSNKSNVSNQNIASNIIEDDGKLDVLPDMTEMSFGNPTESPADDSATIGDESSFVSSATNYTSADVPSDAGVQDASLMAKAISSILASEES